MIRGGTLGLGGAPLAGVGLLEKGGALSEGTGLHSAVAAGVAVKLGGAQGVPAGGRGSHQVRGALGCGSLGDKQNLCVGVVRVAVLFLGLNGASWQRRGF